MFKGISSQIKANVLFFELLKFNSHYNCSGSFMVKNKTTTHFTNKHLKISILT